MNIANDFPREIILSCFDKADSVGALWVLNKRCNKIIKELFFPQFNQLIIKQFPFLKEKVRSIQKEICTETQIFIRLVNHLHDKAKQLGCDIQPSNTNNRMVWECNHIKELSSFILTQLESLSLFEKDKETTFFKEILKIFPPKKKRIIFNSAQRKNALAVKRIQAIESIHQNSDKMSENVKGMDFQNILLKLACLLANKEEASVLLEAPKSLFLAYKVSLDKENLKSFIKLCKDDKGDIGLIAFLVKLKLFINSMNS